MPLPYIIVHLLLTALCVVLAFRLRPGGPIGPVLGLVGLFIVVGGFVVERRSDLAWSMMALGWPDAVFFTNLSLEGVAVLLALLWRSAPDRAARIRAAALSPFALGAALWSLGWVFAPVPPGLAGTIDSRGLCRQSSDQSCAAAAAVTLLHQHGVKTTEAEMAGLCLTRAGFGTPPLGILRGVALRGREAGLKARFAQLSPEGDLQQIPTPCIVSVGLHPNAPPEVAQEMEGYGWPPGLRHAVVLMSADEEKRTVSVADPSYGHEVWPAKGLKWIWDGRALFLASARANGRGQERAARAEASSGARITSPARGERWSAGSRHWITWERASSAGPARLDYTTDRGKRWHDLGALPEGGRFLWTVPDTISNHCQVRITSRPSGPAAESAGWFSIVPSQKIETYRWTRVTPRAEFAPRDGAGALVHRGRMWLLGGWNPGDRRHFPRICNNEVWSSGDGSAWKLEKPNTFLDRSFDANSDWEGRHTAGYVVHRDRMWIVGGDVNQGHYQPDVWSSADGKTWTRVNPAAPVPWGPRALHYTVAFKDRIWVLGGQTMPAFAPSEEAFYRDIWRSADGLHWERVQPKEPYWSPRGMIGGSAVFKDRIWVLGGGTYDTPRTPSRKFYNDVWSSRNGVDWDRHVASAPWEPRQYHDVAVFDGRLWVMEGYSGRNRNDVWYSADGVNWYEVEGTPWKPRHAASVFVHDRALWMVAGNNMESDVWKLQQ